MRPESLEHFLSRKERHEGAMDAKKIFMASIASPLRTLRELKKFRGSCSNALLFCFLALFAPLEAARAQSAPIPESKREALKDYEKKLGAEKNRQKELEDKLKRAEQNVADVRADLVSLAAKIKDNESRLQSLLRRMEKLETEKRELNKNLENDYGSIGQLMLAMQRLKRMPPEAMLARPAPPIDTARSAMLLQSMLPSLYDKAEKLKKDLERLEDLQEALAQNRAELETEKRTLSAGRAQMTALLDKRQALYSGTKEQHEKQQRAVRKIAAQARDLRELVKKLDEDKRRANARMAAQKAVMSNPPRPPPEKTPPRGNGKGELPVAGFIRVGYGAPDDFGAISKGITIKSAPGALVTAPVGGTVRFAGKFKRFGRLVIVEHSGDYHSLIAGLDRIDTVVGQTVAAGEPVGALAESRAEGPSSVYYELRHNGEPVNPARLLNISG